MSKQSDSDFDISKNDILEYFTLEDDEFTCKICKRKYISFTMVKNHLAVKHRKIWSTLENKKNKKSFRSTTLKVSSNKENDDESDIENIGTGEESDDDIIVNNEESDQYYENIGNDNDTNTVDDDDDTEITFTCYNAMVIMPDGSRVSSKKMIIVPIK